MGVAWSDSGREERSTGAREESQRLSEGPRWRDSGGEGEPGGRRGWSDRGLGRTRGDWRLRLSPEQGGSPGGSREQTRQVAARELGALRCPQRSQPRRVPLSGYPAPRRARVPPRSPHKARAAPRTPSLPPTPPERTLPVAAPGARVLSAQTPRTTPATSAAAAAAAVAVAAAPFPPPARPPPLEFFSLSLSSSH